MEELKIEIAEMKKKFEIAEMKKEITGMKKLLDDDQKSKGWKVFEFVIEVAIKEGVECIKESIGAAVIRYIYNIAGKNIKASREEPRVTGLQNTLNVPDTEPTIRRQDLDDLREQILAAVENLGEIINQNLR